MKNIKKIMISYLLVVMISVVASLTLIMLVSQIFVTQRQAQEETADRFEQIRQILAEREADLSIVEENLKQTYLRSAEVVAYTLQLDPELSGDVARLRELADRLGIDEISLFDETGRLTAGTRPESIGLTFDSGEQIAFFKPLLEDKSLRLCQDVVPRTEDGKPMRYSALWSEDGTFIVQVGQGADSESMETERYELSYIFSLLRVNTESELCAIDPESGEIVSSTVQEDIGKNLSELGLDLDTVKKKTAGFHARVNGVASYCVFTTIGTNLVGRIIPDSALYREIPGKGVELTLILVLSVLIMNYIITKHVDKLVIRNIQSVNKTLRSITVGNLEERVDIRNCEEFSELSDHINEMVESLNDRLNNEYQYQAELTEAIKLADAANKSKSSFLFSMSHDIRTPMNAILGFTSMAKKHIDDKEEVLDCLNKINSAGDHLLRLMNNVLDMSHIETGKIEFKNGAHSISESMDATESIFSLEMQEKKIDFSITLDIQDDIVFYDPLRMEQIELNLLSNALKYTPEGGKVTYTVTQTGRTDDGYATYRGVVKDNGIGMSADFCHRAFEPFEREHTSTVNGIPGTGLGLAVTKKIIEQMGGTISCTSELGVGTEFVFTVKLKVASPADCQDEKHNETSEAKFTGKRILLVEDNELNREIAYEILVEYGISVEVAEDGVIAVDKVSHAAPGYYDLILMDIQMPNMDGYQATEEIRKLEDPGLANIPIVAFTANAFDEDRNKAYAVGMNGHLSKPINVTSLIETLMYFL